VIRINLLPWREARRKAQRQHLGVLGGMVAALGLLIVGAVYLTIAGYIAEQTARNEFLKRENVGSTRKSRKSKRRRNRGCGAQNIEHGRQTAATVHLLEELVCRCPTAFPL
jgi:type IV pilus assembly protein PilN